MNWYKDLLTIHTHGKGLYPFTDQVEQRLQRWRIREGMCFLFVQHTSASLAINENFDPTARLDMAAFLEKLAPESQAWYRHTAEGPDDSSSHLRALLTPASLSIPIDDSRLSLGAWQGIYLLEHRTEAQDRHVLLRCLETV